MHDTVVQSLMHNTCHSLMHIQEKYHCQNYKVWKNKESNAKRYSGLMSKIAPDCNKNIISRIQLEGQPK